MGDRHELHYVEVEQFGQLKGFAFCDPNTTYIRYQIAVPNEQVNKWHAVEVCRGGDEPFEFVHLGYYKSRAEAFRAIRKAWTQQLKLLQGGEPDGD